MADVAQDPPAALQPRRLAQRTLMMLFDTDVLVWHLRGYPQGHPQTPGLGSCLRCGDVAS